MAKEKSSINFIPWKGKNYDSVDNCFGFRLAVIGLSFYSNECSSQNCKFKQQCSNGHCRLWAHETIEWLNYRPFKRFCNLLAPDLSAYTVWNSIVFTNYLQIGVSRWNEIRKDCYDVAEQAFFEMIEDPQYKPQKLILWGAQLRDYGPSGDWTWTHSESTPYTGYYRLADSSKVMTYCLTHPSAFKSDEFWEEEGKRLRNWMNE